MGDAAALSRDAFLSHVGKLAEEAVDVEGMGKVLCRELTGAQRAKVLEALAPAVQEGGRADLARYQEMLLENGLIDPSSPADARTPLLDYADVTAAMKGMGASKIEQLCGAIERLSGLDAGARQRAEKNSAKTASSSSSSE